MRRRGGVDDEAAGVAHIGEVREQFQAFDETLAGGALPPRTRLQPERQHGARASRQVLLRPIVPRARRQAGVAHPRHLGVRFEEFGHAPRVFDVPVHAHRQRLDALEQQKGVEGRQRHAHVAQRLHAQLHEKGVVPERVVETQVVVGRRGLGNGGVRRPVEAPRIHHDAGDGGAVPADKLGGRVHDHLGAPVERAAQVGRGKRVVHHERDAAAAPQRGDGFEVENAAARVADGFAVKHARARREGRFPRVHAVGVNESNRQAQLAEGVRELRGRAAIEVRRRHDVVARLEHRREGGVLRRHAARGGNGARAVFERGDALLENRRRGVVEARVDVAVLLELEQLRGVVGVLENVRRGLINGHRAGARLAVGDVAGVQHPRLEAEIGAGAAGIAGGGGGHGRWK